MPADAWSQLAPVRESNDRITKRSAPPASLGDVDNDDDDDDEEEQVAWDALVKRYGGQGGNGPNNIALPSNDPRLNESLIEQKQKNE